MTQKVENVPIKRWLDVWLAPITLAAITLVAIRLWATDWTGDLYILIYLTFFAGMAGIGLGYSLFSPLLSALFSTIYGVFTIGWLFGATVEMDMVWRDRIINFLGWRLRLTIEQFLAGNEINDPILFLTLMAVLLWILGSTAAFLLIRRGYVWPSLIPLGITMLVISHYDQDLARNIRFLMTFLLMTLLIVGRITLMRFKRKWRAEGIQITTETQNDFNKTLVMITAALLLLAWIIPVTPQGVSRYSKFWDRLTEPWDRFSEQISDIFVIDPQPDDALTGYFGETLGLGDGSPASEAVVFTVDVDINPPPGYRNYWRARSYETYRENEWYSNPSLQETVLFPDSFDIPYPDWAPGDTAAYTFTTEASRMANLYFSGLPTAISRPAQAVTLLLPDSQEDLIALLADPQLAAGDSYQIEALVRLPTESELQASSTNYPEWTDSYMQLPDDFSSDIADLAQLITEDLENPFDKAYAITRYLRINIEYTRTISPVPPGADPMEWFLFDEKQGFCNYYATAQVLMLRSLGIPARLSVGYAQGDFDEDSDIYTVRSRDSHAWPEVFFVDYGWIPFEPTASQPALILPAGIRPTDIENNAQNLPQIDEPTPMPEDLGDTEVNADQQPTEVIQSTRIIWYILGAFLVAILTTIIIMIRPNIFKIDIDPLPVLLEGFLVKRGQAIPDWLKHWSRLAQMSAAEKAYRQLGRAIKLIGETLDLSETPAERAQTLTALLPDAQEPALAIVHEYHLDQYSNHIINEERAKKASQQIRHLAFSSRLRALFPFHNKP